ncbi:MAG: leucine-rich repeat domain-containing protein [Spirochaetaceae bacterium]|jgi:hypothetical protein|nr:leucine-rich repeat domain-containing protein [Spirochaetaceae bacterium]
MKYKQLVLVMAALMALSFAGCGGGVSDTPSDSPSYKISLSKTEHTFPAQDGTSYQPETIEVTVTNIGSQPTGGLTARIGGDSPRKFTYTFENESFEGDKTIESIAVGGSKKFSVSTKPSLPTGTHKATVTLSGSNDISAVFNVTFTVTNGAPIVNAITPSANAVLSPGSPFYIVNEQPVPQFVCTVVNAADITAQHNAITTGDGTNEITYKWYACQWPNLPRSNEPNRDEPPVSTASAAYSPPVTIPEGSGSYVMYYYVEVINRIKDNGDGGAKTASFKTEPFRITVAKQESAAVFTAFTAATGAGTDADPYRVILPSMDWEIIKPAVEEALRRTAGTFRYFLDLHSVTGITEWEMDTIEDLIQDNDGKYIEEKIAGIILPDTITKITAAAFIHTNSGINNYEPLTEVHGANVETIENNAFNNKINLLTADFPHLKRTGFSFMNCGFTAVEFTEAEVIGVDPYNGATFQDCLNLTNVNLPNATSIGHLAFNRCANLTTVRIPLAQQIGGNAFKGCPELTDIYLGAVPPDLPGDGLIQSGNLFALEENTAGTITIHVPAGNVPDYTNAWQVDADTPARGNVGVYGIRHKRVLITDAP